MRLRSNRLVGSGQPPDPIASPGDGVAIAPGSSIQSRQGYAVVSADRFNGEEGAEISAANGMDSGDTALDGQYSFDVDGNANLASLSYSNASTHPINNNINNNFIDKCYGPGCHTCPIFRRAAKFVSTINLRQYFTLNLDNDCDILTCKSTNVIYLLTCETCHIQYVGETAQPHMSTRMSAHIRSISVNSTEPGMRYVKAHFTSGTCAGSKFSVNIIEKLVGNGRDNTNRLDPAVTAERRQREKWWINELRTVYPYGLNIRVGSDDHTHENNILSYDKFNKLPSNRTKKRGKYKPKRSIKCMNNSENINNNVQYLSSLLSKPVPDAFKLARTRIFGLPNCVLPQIQTIYNSTLGSVQDEHKQQFDVIRDLLAFRTTRKSTTNNTKAKKRSKAPFMCVKFVNKGIEMVNLPRILHLNDIKRSLPFRSHKDREAQIPIVSYSYPPPIRSKILNYKDVLSEFILREDQPEESFPPCDCLSSPYKDPHHGHVMTGDLSLINNERLRKLIAKGSGYREYVRINWKDTENHIIVALDSLIDKMSNKYHKSNQEFKQFRVKVLEKVKLEISMLKRRYNRDTDNFTPVLKDHGANEELIRIHDSYVLTSVDKASKNISIICKRFYLQSIYNELFNTNTDENVYERFDGTLEAAIKEHHDFCLSIGMKNIMLQDFTNLPFIYFTPKFHKNPTKFRSIVASSTCSTKPLANAISKALQKIRIDRKYWCKTLERYDGINRYWVIDSSQPILSCLSELNETNTAKSVTTYDFSNLYTSLPHDEIFDSLCEIIKEVFNARKKKDKPCCLAIYKSNKSEEIWSTANWVKNPRAGTFFFTEEKLINAIRYQLDNTLFTFGGTIFAQKIGIPMGIDDGPEFANGHLHQCEYAYLNRLKKTDLYKARKLSRTFRFIDDVTSFNADDTIMELAETIYGNRVVLNKENIGTLDANVLDLSITIDGNTNTAKTNLYDKRRAFNFDVVNFPDLSACIPSRMAYGVIPSQLLRYYKSCSGKDGFLYNCNILFDKILQQSYTISNITNKVEAFCKNHLPTNTKYGCNSKRLESEIIDCIPRNITVTGRP